MRRTRSQNQNPFIYVELGIEKKDIPSPTKIRVGLKEDNRNPESLDQRLSSPELGLESLRGEILQKFRKQNSSQK